ncbi:hypothetical protein FXB39_07975 [Nocardioides sp. BGMRC 2183]|nr:hypothetical protein FXB39_07975 [Nocardioides sp. BGMRC 2183]
MDVLTGALDALFHFDLEMWLVLVVGVITGMVVGVLPGLTFVMGVLLLLPLTYGMDTDSGVVLMMAVYVAGTYGGAITALVFRIPGEPNDVPLLWDGYTMTRKGRGAEALGWAAVSAFVGGLVAWLTLAFLAEPAAQVALKFGQPEYFWIVLLGLTSVLLLVDRAATATMVSLGIGMVVAMVGVDPVYGTVRFAFDNETLRSGIDYVPVMVGIYALGHVLARFGERFAAEEIPDEPGRVRTTLPTLGELRRRSGSLARGSLVGSLLGVVPGAGAAVASFVAYGTEKQFGKDRANVGTGSPNGVVAPQAASTATVGGAFVSLLVLGIPGNAATAVILGALMLHDVQPGPQIFTTQPELVSTLVVALLMSVVLMALMGLVAARPMIALLKAPEAVVAAAIVVFAYLGAYAMRNSLADVWVMLAFGFLGFFMERRGYPLAPMVLGAILCPLAERFFVTAMISSGGDPTVFVGRPLSVGLAAVWGVAVLLLLRRWVQQRGSRPPGVGVGTTTGQPLNNEKESAC